jgi:hypothetical protein
VNLLVGLLKPPTTAECQADHLGKAAGSEHGRSPAAPGGVLSSSSAPKAKLSSKGGKG